LRVTRLPSGGFATRRTLAKLTDVRPLCLILLLLICSCDDTDARRIERTPKSLVAEFSSVLQLRANQRTLLAMGTGGQVYFHQPDGSASQVLQSLDTTGQVRATTLTPLRIAKLLNAPDGRPALRAIATLGDGRVVAYFNGSSRRDSLACLVLFDPANDQVRIIASPEELVRESRMGLTIDLADAQMVVSGTTLWLFLRHVDQTAVLRLDTRAVRGGEARVARAFESLRTEEGVLSTKPEDVLSTQADGTVWMLRPSSGELWRVNRDGLAFANKQPDSRPRLSVIPMLLPGLVERDRATLYFFPAEDLAPALDARASVEESSSYPALLLVGATEERFIDRQRLETRPAFPTYAMHLTHWILEPQTNDVFAYDAMSGEVFRIKRAWK